jgi:hypothetical protein
VLATQAKHAVAETISWFHVLRPVEQAQTKAAAQDRIAVVQRSASPAAAGAPEPTTEASEVQRHDLPRRKVGSEAPHPSAVAVT